MGISITKKPKPAGSDGEIQFNNAGSFGASDNLFWDAVNNHFILGAGVKVGIGMVPTAGIHTLEVVDGMRVVGDNSNIRCSNGTIISRIGIDAGIGAYLWLDDEDGNIGALIRGYETGGIQAYFLKGNVGIGTDNPSEALEVIGNVKASAPTEDLHLATKKYVDDTTVTYTDEKAQDAVGGILSDTATIDFTYTDATPEITADVIPGGISHTAIADIGTNTHAQIDTHIASTATPHVSAAEKITWNAKSDLALGETSSTAYRGDRGKTAYDHTSLTNNPHSVTAAQAVAIPDANDSVKDSHINWGAAATQVDADDVPVSATNKWLTTAAQTIAGEKTFSTFPITPSAAPDANYEVANKKYVDDTAVVGDAPSEFWINLGTGYYSQDGDWFDLPLGGSVLDAAACYPHFYLDKANYPAGADFYFVIVAKGSTDDTNRARVYNVTDAEAVTNGELNFDAETSYSQKTSAALTLPAGNKEYKLQIYSDGTSDATHVLRADLKITT